ncbi:nicotinamide-nucleotide amidohydrolase family protein [Corynebacterium suedekumii]|nr:nicotinamide-nucleotide amidohydrolase family protein [Corynebacterium suedekumii]
MFPQTYDTAAREAAEKISRLSQDRGLTVAAAESLTGGTLAACLAAAPGSSDWFAGGVVSYQTRTKCEVLNLPEAPAGDHRSRRPGHVSRVAELMRCDAAVAVTGAGGPDPQEGHPAGTVWVAAQVGEHRRARLHHFPGDTGAILARTRQHALELLLTLMTTDNPEGHHESRDLAGKRSVSVDTVPDPVLEQDNDVIIEVTSTAICGSDLPPLRGARAVHGPR